MSYFKVDLSSASNDVRQAFKAFPHVVTEPDNHDVIILEASDKEIAGKLRHLQLQASAKDASFTYPAEMQIISPLAVVAGRPLTELMREARDAQA